jgi:molybdopterin-binding protein
VFGSGNYNIYVNSHLVEQVKGNIGRTPWRWWNPDEFISFVCKSIPAGFQAPGGTGGHKWSRVMNSSKYHPLCVEEFPVNHLTSGNFFIKALTSMCRETMKISARNQIPGTVKMVKKEPVSTEVIISTSGGNEIVSSITTHSAEKMNLREGSKVYAIIKASEVMVGID